MKFFFFHGRKSITGMMGARFQHPSLDERDILAMVMRMFAQALEAKAVLHVTEGWKEEVITHPVGFETCYVTQRGRGVAVVKK